MYIHISELDGPESARYTFLNRNSELHSKGHRHLLRDDIPVPIIGICVSMYVLIYVFCISTCIYVYFSLYMLKCICVCF
jgi:hypothetical protein